MPMIVPCRFDFPPVTKANSDGLLAIGADLEPDTLIYCYSNGIFPWYEDPPILWFSPPRRMVLFPDELIINRSMNRVLKSEAFLYTHNKTFSDVIRGCAQARQGHTWINNDMIEAYIRLHTLGFAESWEVWHEGSLAGGIYGIRLENAFFAESMFFRVPNASKIALVRMVHDLKADGVHFIDCQVHTENTARFGAREIPRREYIKLLKKAVSTILI